MRTDCGRPLPFRCALPRRPKPGADNIKNQRLIGTVTKNDVIEAYNKEMVKRDMASTLAGYVSAIHKFKKVEVIDGHLMSEMEVPGEFVNHSLQELNLRNRYGIEVILIKKSFDSGSGEKGKVIRPSADYKFQHDDSILILGSPGAFEDIKKMKSRR